MSNALAINLHAQLAVLGQDTDRYAQTVKAIPILGAEEERELAERLFNNDDIEAARLLIMSNLRFVLHIASGYKGYGLAMADLIQEGNVGLMKAVKRFDPNVGVRLVTFAVHWIRAEIHDYIMRNWRIVKVVTTKAQRKLFFNLRSSKKNLGWLNEKDAKTIAENLGVTLKDVYEMEMRMTSSDASFDGHSDDDDDSYAPATYLEDHRYDPAINLENDQWDDQGTMHLHHALNKLDPRSRDILNRRWLSDGKSTLQELATEYGVSAERIRQIENAAMKKLKLQIKRV